MADLDNNTLGMVCGGTIQGEPATLADPAKEFYRLPLKQKNEIVVSVQASSDAEIVLFDGDTTYNSTDVKVKIVLGCKKNSAVSVGLEKDDKSGKYPKETVEMDQVLSATHPKVFAIRWYYGRVMVYNHGFKKPIIVWDGPKHAAFTHIRVRTVNCSGEWQVQSAPAFTTAAGTEYAEIMINSGRLDFEVNGWHDAWIHFFAEPKYVANPVLTACVGGNSAPYVTSGFWENIRWGAANTYTVEAQPPLAQEQYRRFWVKWDAMNMTLGRGDNGNGDTDTPFAWRRNLETTVKPIKYFALQYDKTQSYCYFHILNRTREEDTATRKPGEQHGGGDEVGDVGVQYELAPAYLAEA